MDDQAELAAIWEEHRPLTRRRLALLARAAAAAAAGTLDGALRAEAAAEAHAVAGAAGIFGFAEAARTGRELERALEAPGEIAPEAGHRLVALARRLSALLDPETGMSP